MEQPASTPKIKIKVKPSQPSQQASTQPSPGGGGPSAVSGGPPPPINEPINLEQLEDSDDGMPGLPARRKPGAAGAGRRAAVLLDEDEEDEQGVAAPAASKPSVQEAIYVSDSEEEPGTTPLTKKKPRLTPMGQGKPTVAATQPQQADKKAARSSKSTTDRPQRRKRASAKAFGAEDDYFDPDDLEAEIDEPISEAEEDDDLDVDDDDDDEVPGKRRRASARQGDAKTKRKAKVSKAGGDAQQTAFTFPDDDLGGNLMPTCMGQTDFSHLQLKPDHVSRPLWATPDGHIFLETYSPVYKQAQDFLIAIAEPVSRPEYIHEYQLTPHSLYAAVSVGLDTDTIIGVLSRLSKVHLDEGLKSFIIQATKNYGKVKLVLKRNHFYVETSDPQVFDILRKDQVISAARLNDEVFVEKALKERAVASITRVTEADLSAPTAPGQSGAGASTAATARPTTQAKGPVGSAAAVLPAATAATARGVAAPGFFGDGAGGGAGAGEEEVGEGGRLSIDDVEEGEEDSGRLVRSFEIKGDMVEAVKRRCLPGAGGLNYPMLEEYDFRGDRNTPDLNVELRPHVKLRPYQEKSLSKMFGNGRARSGIIVLPCGAGKSLVGVAAAARMRKSCLCLCTSSVSVDQWKHQFMLWTNLQDHQISRFTSENKEQFAGVAGVTITTFTMVAFSGKRSEESEKVMEAIRSREWGLLLMDEVHVVPAQMFRKVIGIIHSHCKLGLTATLVREDSRIGDLNFLIGPKLYEANWLDLTRAGHIANVQCVEVWCPMTYEFYREYLKPENSNRKQLLYCMNPNKFMACQFLINWHERERKDKVIVFSDNIWALREYATRLGKPFIYGPTSHAERTRVLHAFKNDPNVNTVFLSKVGDNSLDIPEANVLIQISSHAGSRRQEAQRLGRILRAKRAKSGPISATEFNAFFYTLVSQDTQEMYYSTKRQQFLIDQGYAFKVVTNLVDTAAEAMAGQLLYSRKEEQLDLLCRVLVAGLDEAGVEVGARDQEEEQLAQSKGVRRAAGDMRALTGAAGLRYAEYRAAAGPAAAFAQPTLALPSSLVGGKPKASETAKKYKKALGLSKK